MSLTNGRRLPNDRQLDLIWDNFAQLRDLGFLDGNEVTIDGIASGTSTVTVQHGLGRVPRGYIVTRQILAIVLYEVSATATEITFALEGFGSGDRSAKVRVF